MSRSKMTLQNHFLDQGKSFQKLLKFRTWFYLPCALHFNMVCFTCDIYFGYFDRKPMGLSFSVLKASCW